MKQSIYKIVIFLSLVTCSSNTFAEIKLSNALAKDIGQAYGFYLGQDYSLNEIPKKYPSLSGLALIAEKKFSATFKSSIEGMDAMMSKHAKGEWRKIKSQITKQIAGSFNINQINESQARQFIELVSQRAKETLNLQLLKHFCCLNLVIKNTQRESFLMVTSTNIKLMVQAKQREYRFLLNRQGHG